MLCFEELVRVMVGPGERRPCRPGQQPDPRTGRGCSAFQTQPEAKLGLLAEASVFACEAFG